MFISYDHNFKELIYSDQCSSICKAQIAWISPIVSKHVESEEQLETSWFPRRCCSPVTALSLLSLILALITRELVLWFSTPEEIELLCCTWLHSFLWVSMPGMYSDLLMGPIGMWHSFLHSLQHPFTKNSPILPTFWWTGGLTRTRRKKVFPNTSP